MDPNQIPSGGRGGAALRPPGAYDSAHAPHSRSHSRLPPFPPRTLCACAPLPLHSPRLPPFPPEPSAPRRRPNDRGSSSAWNAVGRAAANEEPRYGPRGSQWGAAILARAHACCVRARRACAVRPSVRASGCLIGGLAAPRHELHRHRGERARPAAPRAQGLSGRVAAGARGGLELARAWGRGPAWAWRGRR